ncbi:LysE family translocator [Vibrio astriarenae]|uniref:LysE family translocator n=1 Tax=Vibrio astriarenae TaxID=1481923 RepID=UPI0037366842
MDFFLAIVFFAVSSSITPGPNNILVMTSGVNHGVKKTLPLLTGICIGFTVMLLLVGFGFSAIFEAFPSIHLIIKFIGILYLGYLAYLIATSKGSVESAKEGKQLTFLNGALFQWVNGKAWIVATGAIATYTTADSNFFAQNLMIAMIFFFVSFPCVGVWLAFGSVLKNALNSSNSRKAFNITMASLLLLSVVPVVIELSRMIS